MDRDQARIPIRNGITARYDAGSKIDRPKVLVRRMQSTNPIPRYSIALGGVRRVNDTRNLSQRDLRASRYQQKIVHRPIPIMMMKNVSLYREKYIGWELRRIMQPMKKIVEPMANSQLPLSLRYLKI